jgi:hypothetical protein
MVQRGDAWVSTREVPADVLVHAPAGSRVLRSRAGDVLRPRPGSVFRVVLERTSSRPVYRAEFAEGGGDVDGAGVVVVIGDDVVVERDPAAPKLRLSFAMSDGAPRFAVGEGRAVARAVVSGERLALAAAERGAYLSISDKGGVARRFAKVESWSDDAASRIAEGGLRFVDADFRGAGGITLVGGSPSGGFLAYEVPPVAVGQALRCVNGGAARRMLVNVRAAPAASPTRYVYENGATRVEVEVDACGAVRVSDAAGRRAFVNLAAFRREAPATAALFGDTLGR